MKGYGRGEAPAPAAGEAGASAPFRDRREAGERLAGRVRERMEGWSETPLVLAVSRGGIVVGREVAEALRAPLDVFLLRRLPVPGMPELAMGAVASGGVRMLNEGIIRARGVSDEVVARVAKEEDRLLGKSETALRGGRPPEPIAGRSVVLVTDGAPTAGTLQAAAAAVRTHDPARIVVAVPVVAREAVQALEAAGEREIVCVLAPERFLTTEAWYADFPSLDEAELARMLGPAQAEGVAAGPGASTE